MRIALFQGAPQPLDVPGNLQRLRHQAQLAADRGAQLLVCPRSSGWPKPTMARRRWTWWK